MRWTFFFIILTSVAFSCEARHQNNYGGLDSSLTAKCVANGGEEALGAITAAKENLTKCFERIKGLVEQHASKGAKIRAFCKHEHMLNTCFKEYVQQISFCYNEEEMSALYIATNGTKAGLNYVCYNDGERIEEFIKEEGPECLTEHMKPIMECLMTSMGKFFMTGMAKSYEETVELHMCKVADEYISCINEAVSRCENRKPAEIMRGFMRAIRNSGPCVKYHDPNGAGNSISSGAVRYVFVRCRLGLFLALERKDN